MLRKRFKVRRCQHPSTDGKLAEHSGGGTPAKPEYLRAVELLPGQKYPQRDLLLDFASDLLKSKMEKEENVQVVQNALKQVLGDEFTVRCRTRASMRTQLPPNVDSDGMVATAINDLGGEIVDIQ